MIKYLLISRKNPITKEYAYHASAIPVTPVKLEEIAEKIKPYAVAVTNIFNDKNPEENIYEKIEKALEKAKAQFEKIDDEMYSSTLRELDNLSQGIGEKMDEIKQKLSVVEQIGQFISDIQQYVQAIGSSLQQLMSSLWNAQDNQFDKEQDAIDKQNDALDKALDKQQEIVERHKDKIDSIEDPVIEKDGVI